MPLGTATIFDVRTTGSDTACGGAFDPGQTAGMFTDGAATSATGNSPVFTSASYSFVAGDAGAWLFIGAGTNWTQGWYQIASVATGAATLSAAVGQAYLRRGNMPAALNSTAGCATTASPTGATWSIDYSQQNTAQVSFTDLESTGTGLTVSSPINTFGRQWVGNALQIASGTNFNAGVYVIASVAAGVATVVGAGNITTGAGASGVGYLGGAFATPGKAGQYKIAGNSVFIKSGTYTNTSSSANVSGGRVSDTTGGASSQAPTWWVGWDTERSIINVTTSFPEMSAGSTSSLTLMTYTNSQTKLRNLAVDGNTQSSLTGLSQTGNYSQMTRVYARRCTVVGVDARGGNGNSASYVRATSCSGTAGIRIGGDGPCVALFCESYGNTTSGFAMDNNSVAIDCISSGNSGASSFGFASTSVGYNTYGCTAYGNGSHGFDCENSIANISHTNAIAEGNGGAGFYASGAEYMAKLLYCAGYNNTSGNYNTANITDVIGFVTGSATFFTNAASGDFSLNNTAGGGALLRGTGAPGTFPRGTTVSYADIGAAQHQDSGGGGLAANPLIGYLS